jgi:hypothetical protein
VRLGELSGQRAAPRAGVVRNRLGFTVVALHVRYAARLGRPGRSDIPVITAVDPFSPGRPRLQAGQAILSLNGETVTVGVLQRTAARFRSGDLISLVVAHPGAPSPVPEIINYRVR